MSEEARKKDGRTDRWADEQLMDGQMDGRKEGWPDGQTDNASYKQYLQCTCTCSS